MCSVPQIHATVRSRPRPKPRAARRHICEVEIPAKGLFRQIVLAQALEEQIIIRDALASADDFAVPFWGASMSKPRARSARSGLGCM